MSNMMESMNAILNISETQLIDSTSVFADIDGDALDELQWQCDDEEWTLNTTIHCDSNLLYPILTKDTTNLDKRVSDIYYYHPDHLGSATWITNSSWTPVQFIHYMPFGELWYNQQASAHNERFKFTGKERDTETGYDYFGARYYSSALPMWLSVDPFAEKYPSISPYAYCNWNPVKLIDPDGEEVKPCGTQELKMILNTLPRDSWNYVQLDENGLINRNLLNSYSGISLNLANLRTLANSDMLIEVILDDQFTFCGNDGVSGINHMAYFPYDEDFSSIGENAIMTISGLSTGEYGFMGKVLFPDRDGMQNSCNGNIIVIVNINLSPPGAAESYSHEANGHALLYILNGGDHKGASHQPINNSWTEGNITLKNMIIRSKQETYKNMQEK